MSKSNKVDEESTNDQVQEVVLEPIDTMPANIETVATPRGSMKYICDACTQAAFYLNPGDGRSDNFICQSCGKSQTFKPENLVSL